MDGEDDLRSSLVELAGLVADSATLEETLSRIADYAMLAIRPADGAALTLLEGGRPMITVASDPAIRGADEVQYAVGQGPCLDAMAERRVVSSPSLGAEPAWPRYGARVVRMGLHSVLAVPMELRGTVIGVVSMYARNKSAFDESAIRIAQLYATPAAAMARNARIIAHSEERIAQLDEALRIRPVVDQAIGIIRSRTGQSEEEAFQRLRHISNTEHIKIADVSVAIVEKAVRRANERRRRARSIDNT